MDKIFNFICMSYNKAATNRQYFNDFLSQWELEKIKCSVNKRKNEFLYGRLCAKFSYANLCGTHVFDNRLSIYNDSYGAPFFADGSKFVSITHEEDFAAAIVTDRKQLCVGIDVQKISLENANVIYETMSINEKSCVEEQNVLQEIYGRNFLITAVWVAKEALSKLLGHGFWIYNSLEVSNFQMRNNYLFTDFKIFNNFSVMLRLYKNYLLGFALCNKELDLFCKDMFLIEETPMSVLTVQSNLQQKHRNIFPNECKI